MHWLENPLVARYTQVGLLFVYGALAALFALHKKTWPIALYYIGCLVKDSSVYILSLFL